MAVVCMFLSAVVFAAVGHGFGSSDFAGMTEQSKRKQYDEDLLTRLCLQRIAKDLNAKQVLVFAVATVYFLAQTVFQLLFSHISHGLGRRYVYLSGVGFYIIGAIIAATSSTAQALVGARAVQGLGAAGMTTVSAIVIVDIMQPRERAAWVAISQAFGAFGNICGPLFAGLLFKRFNWVGSSGVTPPPPTPPFS